MKPPTIDDRQLFCAPPPFQQLMGDEHLILGDNAFPASNSLDFWRWAFTDMRMNNIRGVLAEYIVARLLHIPLKSRRSWDSYDLRTPDGITIEVKVSAYLQAWEQQKASQILFTGLRTRPWSPETGYDEEGYGADVYICCLLAEKDPNLFDPLNLDQWQFWLLSQGRVIAPTNNGKSLSLTALKKAGIKSHTAADLAEHGPAMLRVALDYPGDHGG